MIDWGQLSIDFKPDGPITFRVSEISGLPDFRYICNNFMTQRSLVIVTFPLSEHPTSQVVDSLASFVNDLNLKVPSVPVVLVGTFSDVAPEGSSDSGDMLPIWKKKLTVAFQQGDPTLMSSSTFLHNSTSNMENFDISLASMDSSMTSTLTLTEDIVLPGNCRFLSLSNAKNRKKNASKLLKEAHQMAFDWRGGSLHFGASSVGRSSAIGVSMHGTGSLFNTPPTLKQTVPAVFADLEVVCVKIAHALQAAKLSPVLRFEEFEAAVRQQLADSSLKPFRDVDELNNCVKFLHEIGLIVNFDEPSVSDLYFLNVQWLSHLIAETFQYSSSSSQPGLLQKDKVFQILMKYEPTGQITKENFLALLSKLDAAYHWDSGNFLLVPGYLPSIENVSGIVLPLKIPKQSHRNAYRQTLMEHNQVNSPTLIDGDPFGNRHDLNRFYLVNHIPLSFWPRLIVRMLPCGMLAETLFCIRESYGVTASSSKPVLKVWDTRIEICCSEAMFPCVVIEQIDRLHLRPGGIRWGIGFNGQMMWSASSSVSLISVRISADAVGPNPILGARLLSLITDLVDTLLEDWYPAIGTRFAQDTLGSYLVYRMVPCPDCFSGPELGMVPCFMPEDLMAGLCPLTLQKNSEETDQQESSTSENSSKNCPKGHLLDLAYAAPDLLFNDIPKSHVVDCASFLDKATLLGCGAFGPVVSVSLAKLAQQNRKSALMHQTTEVGGEESPVFLPRSSSFGNKAAPYCSRSVAIKFFNPVDIEMSHVSGTAASQAQLADQNRRLNDQLTRRFKADPIRLACESYTMCRQELSNLIALKHPHICGLVGISLQPLGILLQLAPLGSLHDWLLSYRRIGQQLAPHTVVQVAAQVADAINYLHSMGIIFRDLKADNVLVWRFPRPSSNRLSNSTLLSDVPNLTEPSNTVLVRVSDFSISRWSGGFGCRGQAGTPGFMAPEIVRFNGDETYDEKVDCFSFGMLMYELLTLRLPFENRPSVNARHAILGGMMPPPTMAMFSYGQLFTDLIAACWRKNPSDRPSASQILRIANWPGMTKLVSVSSVDGRWELLKSLPTPASCSIRGLLMARWSPFENKCVLESLAFDGDGRSFILSIKSFFYLLFSFVQNAWL